LILLAIFFDPLPSSAGERSLQRIGATRMACQALANPEANYLKALEAPRRCVEGTSLAIHSRTCQSAALLAHDPMTKTPEQNKGTRAGGIRHAA
jgi:hypothetical protein